MTPHEPERSIWFANRGQILQLLVACIACVFAGVKAWPEMKQNEFLSAGALLFYALVALVLISLGIALDAISKARRSPPAQAAPTLRNAILRQWWSAWAALGDMYERLDYDNRGNTSTRLPFYSASWPRFGDPWTYVDAQLYKNAALVDTIKRHTEATLKNFGWTDYAMPRTEEAVVMVDFIRDIREFQAYLDGKLKAERD